QPWDTGYLVRDVHEIYYEQCGAKDGIAVVFLHRGPGAGCSPAHRRLFDPKTYRAILFDQRGCGRSRPYASIKGNNTDALVEDIEALRCHLGLDKLVLFGGSWGSTLALCYGLRYPENCAGFVLRGIFLGTKAEIDWFLYEMGRFFPEAQKEFLNHLPEPERGDILKAYYKRLTSLSSVEAISAAKKWASYENSCATLAAQKRGAGDGALAISLIESHYFVNGCFLPDGYILDNLGKISHLPAVIVNGRHDVICPPFTARKLCDKWGSKATIHLIDTAGHSAFEQGMLSALMKGLDKITQRLP
ncbi:MAG: prolyl aminopeptidase, partial [Candidatus Puniceispirillaceae bacterium]